MEKTLYRSFHLQSSASLRSTMVRFPRRIRIVLLFIITALLVLEIYRLETLNEAWENPLHLFGTRDFIAFWAGMKVFLGGGNPYDDALILAIQKPIHPNMVDPQVYLNPPWAILPMLPLGWFDLSVSSSLWILCNLIFWCAAVLSIVLRLPGSRLQRYAAGLIGLLSVPSFFNVWMGQLSLGILMASLGAMFGYKHRKDILVGFCLAILMVKPHLVFLFGLVVGLEFIRERRWKIPASFILFFGCMCLFPVLTRPHIYQEWMNREFSPLLWKTATVSSLIRYAVLLFTGKVPAWPVYTMPLLGMLLFLGWYLRQGLKIHQEKWLGSFAFLLLISIICAPYAWLYDFCLLLPAQLYLVHFALSSGVSENRRNTIIALILTSQLGIGFTGYFTKFLGATVWVPLVVAIAWIVAQPAQKLSD